MRLLKLFFISIIAFLFISVIGCNQSKQAPTKIKVGYIQFVTDLPLFVALENGYFKKRGLEVEAVKCGDSSEAMNLLLSGHIDAVAHLAFSVFWTAEEKASGRFKVFLPCYETGDSPVSYLLVRSNSPITNLTQLRGKKIGTITGITQLVYLKLLLEDLKIDPKKDVTIIQVTPTLQVQALQAGQFDALFTVDPYGTIILQKGMGKLLLTNPRSKHIVDPFWAAAAAMSSKLASHPNEAIILYEGMAEAVDFIRKDEIGAKSILPKYTPLDVNIASKVGLYKYAKIDEQLDFSKVQELADKMQNYGALNSNIDVKSMFMLKAELTSK
jgi:NitT/TauT family transport system substrate-binding protein